MKLSKHDQKKIAKERVDYLLNHAQKVFSKSPGYSNRYVQIALDLRNKYNIKLTSAQKKKFCKKCHIFLVPGKNCIVRIKNKTLLYHCKNCGFIRKQGMRTKNVK